MFDLIHGFMDLMNEVAKAVESFQHKSSKEIADFCIKEVISPVEVMFLANQGIKYLKEEEGCDDPKELFPGVFDYLEHNGFTYDEKLCRFRES